MTTLDDMLSIEKFSAAYPDLFTCNFYVEQELKKRAVERFNAGDRSISMHDLSAGLDVKKVSLVKYTLFDGIYFIIPVDETGKVARSIGFPGNFPAGYSGLALPPDISDGIEYNKGIFRQRGNVASLEGWLPLYITDSYSNRNISCGWFDFRRLQIHFRREENQTIPIFQTFAGYVFNDNPEIKAEVTYCADITNSSNGIPDPSLLYFGFTVNVTKGMTKRNYKINIKNEGRSGLTARGSYESIAEDQSTATTGTVDEQGHYVLEIRDRRTTNRALTSASIQIVDYVRTIQKIVQAVASESSAKLWEEVFEYKTQ